MRLYFIITTETAKHNVMFPGKIAESSQEAAESGTWLQLK